MFVLPVLPYDYSSLEPYIDTETMHIHHDKHHATYVKNLNDLLVGHDDLLNIDVNDLLSDLSKVPEEIRTKVKNNAGGVANHTLFWEIMCSNDKFQMPNDKFTAKINESFGNFDTFSEKFTAAALGHFGSGWAWLTVDGGNLEIIDTLNQDSPISDGKTPILLLDVWEHAYYLKYKNMRADYIKAWWNVVNWKKVGQLYEKAGEKI